VAGKRASLSEINTLLQTISGVKDGVFLPCTNSERLVVFVVSNLSKTQILSELRQGLDPVFLPRTLVYLPRIPRNELGKLVYSDLVAKLPC